MWVSPLQLLVAPLQKLTPKANATIKDIGTIESLVQSFGPYITGTSSGHMCHDYCVFDKCIAWNVAGLFVGMAMRLICCRYMTKQSCLWTGTNLEDEDVLAKNVMDINGRTVMPFHSLCVTNQMAFVTGHCVLPWSHCSLASKHARRCCRVCKHMAMSSLVLRSDATILICMRSIMSMKAMPHMAPMDHISLAGRPPR